ncbi:MAG: hypothetical protein OXC84_13810 [Gammaproteobacteria bacterium]|nr:hypothetical protein [Gammaproteobacteria bacterium]
MKYVEAVPEDIFRSEEGLGVWEHRGKVVAIGIGHAPTARRWDNNPETCVGAISIYALRQAMVDAGVDPSHVDGLVIDPVTSTGADWPRGKPIPQVMLDRWEASDDPLDGLTKNSICWLLKNMPELTGIKFAMNASNCMSRALVAAAQAVGEGETHTCLVLKAWNNFEGRYYHGGANDDGSLPGSAALAALTNLWGTPACYATAMQFNEYCRKYGKSHAMMAPFMENSRRNGLLFPEGYWAQHRPEELRTEDYLAAPWIAEPANLFDNDLPIMCSGAYLLTTSERAPHLAQPPVYILNHASSRTLARSIMPTLEEVEADTARTGRKIYEGAGITAEQLSFENMYDGFSLFHQFHLEGLGFRGVGFGEALDFYQTDISIQGPNPVSPSGGNIGSGRSRFWMHTDCIQQIQGRAGARQITGIPAEVGVSGGPMPLGGNFTVWGEAPD